jgi:hypothetical protein
LPGRYVDDERERDGDCRVLGHENECMWAARLVCRNRERVVEGAIARGGDFSEIARRGVQGDVDALLGRESGHVNVAPLLAMQAGLLSQVFAVVVGASDCCGTENTNGDVLAATSVAAVRKCRSGNTEDRQADREQYG